MSLQEQSEHRAPESMQVDQVAEGALTELFQQLKIGRAGEPMMSDPTRLVTPMEVIRQRKVSARDPMLDASDELVLLKVLDERVEPLSPIELVNVIGGWAQVYGWHPIQQG